MCTQIICCQNQTPLAEKLISEFWSIGNVFETKWHLEIAYAKLILSLSIEELDVCSHPDDPGGVKLLAKAKKIMEQHKHLEERQGGLTVPLMGMALKWLHEVCMAEDEFIKQGLVIG